MRYCNLNNRGDPGQKGENKMDKAILIFQSIGCALLSMFISTIVHEGGHVVAGLIQKWKFVAMAIGPIKIYRDETTDKIKLGLERNPALWGGYGGTMPRTQEDAKIETFGKILLAGPVASIIFGVITAIIMIAVRPLFLVFLAPVSIGMGIACLIPGVKTGILYNDGSRYMRIKKGGQTALEEKAVFDATMVTYFDENATIAEDGIEALTRSKDAEFRYLGHYYAYTNAKTIGDSDKEKEHLTKMEALKESVPKSIIDMCMVQ